jgi:hypothetical protein
MSLPLTGSIAQSASGSTTNISLTQSSPPVTSSASVDEGRSDRARPGYRLCVFVVSAVVLMVVLFLL